MGEPADRPTRPERCWAPASPWVAQSPRGDVPQDLPQALRVARDPDASESALARCAEWYSWSASIRDMLLARTDPLPTAVQDRLLQVLTQPSAMRAMAAYPALDPALVPRVLERARLDARDTTAATLADATALLRTLADAGHLRVEDALDVALGAHGWGPLPPDRHDQLQATVRPLLCRLARTHDASAFERLVRDGDAELRAWAITVLLPCVPAATPPRAPTGRPRRP